MTSWVRWTLPPVIVTTVMQPVQAVEYLSIADAQHLAFPTASQFVEANVVYRPSDVAAIERLSGQKVQTRGEQVWRAQAGGRLLGYFIVDYVIGKHEVIDYAVSLEADGRVRRVDILQYRESYGGEIANHDWLNQFVGRTSRDPPEFERNIRNISGATLSSRHVTDGIRRVLAIYETCLH
jgi:Na+-translocating ferredoxin:NAD+ oxidoreductase RnfG subunit